MESISLKSVRLAAKQVSAKAKRITLRSDIKRKMNNAYVDSSFKQPGNEVDVSN
ncbi:hypothetical protein M513_11356 [Trichuris suis]|uniref:Uncharacterized protein n=1 Tax=Trichuris suis TaxID=68888 RepID=A0A085LRZ8_9BILA|nr:hypothetical protein M513_11356 [Trichuris suis]